MTLYRTKPVVIEAYRYEPRRIDFFSGMPSWLEDAYDLAPGKVEVAQPGSVWNVGRGELRGDREYALRIVTLEGVVEAAEGDWIVRGVQGELYPVKPDIFAATYEAVEDAPA